MPPSPPLRLSPPPSRRTASKANAVDIHFGRRLRRRRVMLGISLAQLAKSIGVTFQQIQKYECGANRVGSSRLWELSRALLCPVSFFFEGMDERTANASPRHLSAGKADFAPRLQLEDTTTDRETVRLVRAYLTIKDINARQGVIELVKSLSPPMGVAPDPYDPERTTAPEAEVTATYVA